MKRRGLLHFWLPRLKACYNELHMTQQFEKRINKIKSNRKKKKKKDSANRPNHTSTHINTYIAHLLRPIS